MDIHLINLRKTALYLFVAIVAAVCSVDTALAQGNTLSVSTNSLVFNTNAGTPQPQSVTVYSKPNAATFSATVASLGNFLGVSSTGGSATPGGTILQIFIINGVNLATGTYPGTVTITSGSQTVTIDVTYYVGTNSGGGGGNTTGPVSANPSSLTYTVAANPTTAPPSQMFTLSTTGAQIGVTLLPTSTGNWLSVSPSSFEISSSLSQPVTVSVSPQGLAQGVYTGEINVYQNSSATSSLTIYVTLNVGTTTATSNLSITPSSLNYTFSTAGASQSMTLQVSDTSNVNLTVSAATSVSSGSGWLSVSPASPASLTISASVGGTFTVTVNSTSLSGGTYKGDVLLTANGETTSIPVTVTVGASTATELTASPDPITFSIPSGSTAQAVNQSLTVGINRNIYTTGTVAFNTAASTTNGGNWLSVNPTGLQSVTLNSNATLTVSVYAQGLNTGTYDGNITLTPIDGSAPLVVPVTATVGTAPTLTVAPASLSFAYQTGTATPPVQTLSLTSSGSMIPFSVIGTTTSGGNWLVVSPQSGATAASGGGATNLTVYVNPTGLAPGTYMGSIAITATSAANTAQSIPVMLLVSSQPILTVGATSVMFNYQYGSSTLPAQQQIPVTSSGNPVSFTASVAPGSGGNWLMVTPSSGTTPQSLNLSAVPGTLAPGTYSETITVTAFGAGNSPVTINAYLVVGNNTLLTPSQTALLFNYEIGKAVPAVQTFTLTSNGSPVTYSVSATSSNCGGQFLSVSPSAGTTPGTIAVAINTEDVTAGTCKGTITIASTDASVTVGNSPLTIPVTLNVSNSPLLNVSPSAVNVSTQVGTNPANQTIALTSTDSTVALAFNVNVTTTTGTGWLLVGPTSGATPNNLTLAFQTSGLATGTYTGSVTVTPAASGSVPTVIPVTVVVTSGTTASATPASLTFTQPYGGSAPAAQSVQIASTTAGLTFSTSTTVLSPTGGNWLSVTPANGATPGTVMVSANGSTLSQGSYSGVVTVLIPGAANTPLNIQVTLTIGPPLSLAVSPTNLTFTYVAGSGTAPAAQTVQVTSTAGSIPFAVTSATSTPTGLITFTPSNGNTTGTLTIGLSQSVLSTLSAGTYSGALTVTSSSLSGISLTINVTVTVQPPPTPAVTSVLNAASDVAGAVAPGEIISLFGTNIGPATPTSLQLTSTGMVPTTIADTQVTFDGIAAPIIYVSSGQINAIVPYEIAGRATTNLIVTRSSVASASLTLNVADTAPAIFTLSQGGNGQGAILNQNNSVNGTSTPAAPGSVIAIYATGEGMLQPAGTTGGVTTTTAPFPIPVGAVSLTIGGQTAQILYAGEAPGEVSGVLQVNAVVPAGAGAGPQALVLTVGSATNAQQTVTVAVQ